MTFYSFLKGRDIWSIILMILSPMMTSVILMTCPPSIVAKWFLIRRGSEFLWVFSTCNRFWCSIMSSPYVNFWIYYLGLASRVFTTSRTSFSELSDILLFNNYIEHEIKPPQKCGKDPAKTKDKSNSPWTDIDWGSLGRPFVCMWKTSWEWWDGFCRE